MSASPRPFMRLRFPCRLPIGTRLRVGIAVSIVLPLSVLGTATVALAADTTPRPVDDAEMIYLPGGEFEMGVDGYGDASPPHGVRLSPFYLDRCEVTNAQYQAFCEATHHRLPDFWGLEAFRCGAAWPDHPVVGVSHYDATAYARWRAARLPTEAEWEYAGRGGLVGRAYSHGDDLDSTLYVPTGYVGTAHSFPVGSFPPNGLGLCDMTGNVREWVADAYDDEYYHRSPAVDPRGPGHGLYKVTRGGGWHTGPGCAKIHVRELLRSNWIDFAVGFRCARYVGRSAAERLEALIDSADLAAALEAYDEMSAADPGRFYFDEAELNELGYQLVRHGELDAALAVFERVVTRWPDSFNAHDSLGEVRMLRGEREAAIRAYERSLELNPESAGGRAKLAELQGGS